MQLKHPLVRVIIACMLGFLAWTAVSCSTTTQPTEGKEITYHLTWNSDGVDQTNDGWFIENNLGYSITLKTGYLTTAAIQLVPCEEENAAQIDWFAWLAPKTVFAGHGDSSSNPSRWIGPFIESLSTPELSTLGTITLEEVTNYCRGHYLVAQATDSAMNLPTDVDMSRSTIFLQGEYIPPGGNEAVPFTIETLLAWGALDELSANEMAQIALPDQPSNIIVERQLSSIFDDLDFLNMETSEWEMAVLRSISNHTQISLQTTNP
ncbi:MAG: hypothetical protein AAF490_09270 [Chloroflexota bacterium]